jgi:methyl-accepting chemotaxis protein
MENKLILILVFLVLISSFVYSVNHLDDCTKRLYFQEAFIKAMLFDEDYQLTEGIPTQGFMPYDWKELPGKAEDPEMMYIIKAEFSISSRLKDCHLGIFLGPADYFYLVYINNELVSKRGDMDRLGNHATLCSDSELLSHSQLRYDTVNSITIQLFPGKLKRTISGLFIASQENVETEAFLRNFFGMRYANVIGFLAVVLGIYFLLTFFSNNKETKYLFFSLTSFFYAINTVNLSFFYNFADVLLLTRLSRIGFAMCAAFACLFVIEFTKILSRHIWVKILILVPGVIFSGLVIVLYSKADVDMLFDTVISPYYIVPILLINITLAIISIFKDKNKNSIYILLGLFAILITGLIDSINLNSYRWPYMWSIPYGYTVLVLSIFYVLSKEQADIFAMTIHQRERLDKRNKSMSSMIEKIRMVSEGLTKSYKRLDSIISHSIDVIQEYEKSNTLLMKDSVHHLDNVEEIVNQIKNRIEESNIRVPKTITSQTSAVEHITSTVGNMNTHLETTVQSTEKVNDSAKDLAEIAGTSSDIIHESRLFIKRISDYSKFITGVLNTIEDITEKTKILSINAAVEAARAGATGKGFSVVAQEIRKLAQQSQAGLNSSFSKIKEMQETIKKSNVLAEEVEQSLSNIIERSRHSALNINDITRLIQDQKTESSRILKDVQSFSADILTLQELSVKEVSENEKVKESLTKLKETFLSITNQLKGQMSKGDLLQKLLADINTVMDDNIENVEILQQCITEAAE